MYLDSCHESSTNEIYDLKYFYFSWRSYHNNITFPKRTTLNALIDPQPQSKNDLCIHNVYIMIYVHPHKRSPKLPYLSFMFCTMYVCMCDRINSCTRMTFFKFKNKNIQTLHSSKKQMAALADNTIGKRFEKNTIVGIDNLRRSATGIPNPETFTSTASPRSPRPTRRKPAPTSSLASRSTTSTRRPTWHPRCRFYECPFRPKRFCKNLWIYGKFWSKNLGGNESDHCRHNS
jgi:hypothetical protein